MQQAQRACECKSAESIDCPLTCILESAGKVTECNGRSERVSVKKRKAVTAHLLASSNLGGSFGSLVSRAFRSCWALAYLSWKALMRSWSGRGPLSPICVQRKFLARPSSSSAFRENFRETLTDRLYDANKGRVATRSPRYYCLGSSFPSFQGQFFCTRCRYLMSTRQYF
jgi:hypothetical protein